jgi:prepilin signal peptidase PulO-like enzyme (type II secretory pathway)
VVELLTAACFGLAYWYSPTLYGAAAACLLVSVLITASLIDLDTREIPNGAVLTVLVLAAAVFAAEWIMAGWSNILLMKLIGFFAVSLPMLVIARFTGGFGGGDIKLMAAAGLYLGAPGVALAFLAGCALGALYGLLLIFKKKAGRKTAIPFAPFLSAGIFAGLLFGDRAIAAYMSLF